MALYLQVTEGWFVGIGPPSFVSWTLYVVSKGTLTRLSHRFRESMPQQPDRTALSVSVVAHDSEVDGPRRYGLLTESGTRVLLTARGIITPPGGLISLRKTSFSPGLSLASFRREKQTTYVFVEAHVVDGELVLTFPAGTRAQAIFWSR